MDNRLVHIGLICAAIYVIVQIMNKNAAQEHLDSGIITPEGGAAPTVTVVPAATASNTSPSAIGVTAVTTGSPAPALQPVSLDGLNPAGTPVVNISGTALTTTASSPSPLASTSETLHAAAPASLPGDSVADFNSTVQAVDPDFLFGRRTALDPSELIPKTQPAELYAGLKPDPALTGDFLQNRFALGIDTSISRNSYVNDLRGLPSLPPVTIVSPWGNSTHSLDLMRKSLAEVS